MINYFTEMLEFPNFGHMITYIKQFGSLDKFLLVTSQTEIGRHKLHFKISIFVRRSTIVSFADINKIATKFININLKDSRKDKRIEIMYCNAIYICIS